MRGRGILAGLVLAVACTIAASARPGHRPPRGHRPSTDTSGLRAITSPLCVTTGVAQLGKTVDQPEVRAIAKGTDGEAAALAFTFRGETPNIKELASGDLRRQLGVKLRAENGCNLLYVMWRLDPRPMVYVSLKRNPGDKDHKACGATGYTKVKPKEQKPPPPLVAGEHHTLRAEIVSEQLSVFIDDTVYWRGPLPATAAGLRGPAGIRSDNLTYDLSGFAALPTSQALGNAKCVAEDND
jgi:hypothetical protein